MSNSKSVTISTRPVGQCFGVVGQLIAADGHVVTETRLCPHGFDQAAVELANGLAIELGYDISQDVASVPTDITDDQIAEIDDLGVRADLEGLGVIPEHVGADVRSSRDRGRADHAGDAVVTRYDADGLPVVLPDTLDYIARCSQPHRARCVPGHDYWRCARCARFRRTCAPARRSNRMGALCLRGVLV